MKKLLIALILIAGGVSPLFCMTAQERETLKRLQEKEKKRKLKKKLQKKEAGKREPLEARMKEIDEFLEEMKQKESERYLKDFAGYKAQEKERIAQEGAIKIVHITNNSKWNLVVRYKHEDSGDTLQKLPIMRNKDNKLLMPEGITSLEIVPDSSYWRSNLATLKAEGKIKMPDLISRINRILNLHQDKSIGIEVTIPSLPGGKFEGFAFDVTPLDAEAFELTLEEYIKKRKSGEIQAPKPQEDELTARLREREKLLQEIEDRELAQRLAEAQQPPPVSPGAAPVPSAPPLPPAVQQPPPYNPGAAQQPVASAPPVGELGQASQQPPANQ